MTSSSGGRGSVVVVTPSLSAMSHSLSLSKTSSFNADVEKEKISTEKTLPVGTIRVKDAKALFEGIKDANNSNEIIGK